MLIDVERLKSFPPFLVVALARNSDGKELTMPEIAATAELPIRTVCRISTKLIWAGITLENIEKFCRGCNFDLKSSRGPSHFMRRTASAKSKFSHLSPIRRRTFEKRIVEWSKLPSSG